MTLNEITDGWPLIRLLMDDPIYHALYVDELAAINSAPLTQPETFEAHQRV